MRRSWGEKRRTYELRRGPISRSEGKFRPGRRTRTLSERGTCELKLGKSEGKIGKSL